MSMKYLGNEHIDFFFHIQIWRRPIFFFLSLNSGVIWIQAMETSSMCEHKCCGLYHCALTSTIQKKRKNTIGTRKLLSDDGDEEEDAAVWLMYPYILLVANSERR